MCENQYGGKGNCPLNCWGEDEQPNEDTQQHLLMCAKLQQEITTQDLATEKVRYEHLFGNTVQQKEATVLFKRLLDARKLLQSNPPGEKLDRAWSAASAIVMPSLLHIALNVLLLGNKL